MMCESRNRLPALLLPMWLEQAASLKQLRMHDHAYRVLNRARGITLESMQADPSDPMVWVNIGRVQLADEKFDSAKEVLDHAKELAQQSGNITVEGFANAALFQVLRQQPSASQEAFDLTNPLTQAQYRAYQRQNLGQMFYVCQSCGHLNLMLGEHCAHCRFAPQDLSDAQLSMTLSALNFKTPTLLTIALQIQRGRKPHEFIDGLDAILSRFDTDQGILEKIRLHGEDDHLDFKALDRCASCGKVVWASSADECPNCHANLNRPMLLKLAICVDRLLQQWVWTVRGGAAQEFEQFVILLVNLKYSLIRAQMAPTDAQRHAATELLLKISPLYTQNGGGMVWIKSANSVVSEVLNPEVHKDIGPTIDFLRDELKHFLRLVSDAVSLF
jgi:rubrerythrin